MANEKINVVYSANVSNLINNLNKVDNKVKSTSNSMKSADNSISKFGKSANFSKIGSGLANLGKIALSAGVAIGTAMSAIAVASVNASSDFDENVSRMDAVFGDMADSYIEKSKNIVNQTGLSANAYLDTIGLLGQMANSMGLPQEEALKMADSLAVLSADMSSFFNKDVEQAKTALKGIFTGETEALKEFGIVMTETNLEDFASRTGKVYDSMSQAEKVQLRYNYVMEQTKNVQGDYARTADGYANSMRTLQSNIDNLMISLGESMKNSATGALQQINGLFFVMTNEPTKVQQSLQQLQQQLSQTTDPAQVENLTNKINVLQNSINMKPKLDEIKNSFMEIWNTLTQGFSQMFQGIDIFGLLEQNLNFLKDAFAQIMPVLAPIVNTFLRLSQELLPKLWNLFNQIISAIRPLIDIILPPLTALLSGVAGVVGWLIDLLSQLFSWIGKITGGFRDFLGGIGNFLGFSAGDYSFSANKNLILSNGGFSVQQQPNRNISNVYNYNMYTNSKLSLDEIARQKHAITFHGGVYQ